MFERLAERWRDEAGSAIRLAVIGGACALTGAIALGFLCAAAFIYVLDHYGPVEACLAGAAVFLGATAILLVAYATVADDLRRRESLRRAAAPETPSPLADPKLILVGLQVAQAIGIKRLLPILAVGGAAFLFAASRPSTRRARGRGVEPPPAP
jgi:hypothetical protein